MNTIAIILGYGVLIFIASFIVILVIDETRYQNDENFFTFTLFRFGIVYCRSEVAMEQIQEVRPSAKRKLQVSAPTWFNKHVYNIGGTEQ